MCNVKLNLKKLFTKKNKQINKGKAKKNNKKKECCTVERERVCVSMKETEREKLNNRRIIGRSFVASTIARLRLSKCFFH